ncbi:hypothetical protein BLA29_013225 [Euroglyphus maynei]|uniref:Uncharacterized protein n=1 Tax=Euroglyphus maynei TaxID=6958 RepID=A0A1Y3APQ4_EURMA|nr:hypothetical protein BLA29_013225 [Euroglyphus maynei]
MVEPNGGQQQQSSLSTTTTAAATNNRQQLMKELFKILPSHNHNHHVPLPLSSHSSLIDSRLYGSMRQQQQQPSTMIGGTKSMI